MTSTTPAAPGAAGGGGGGAAARTGQIHDTGYQPYVGDRTRYGGRFLVIARNVFSVSMRSRGVKVTLVLALLITVGAMVAMSLLGNTVATNARSRGAPIPKVDQVILLAVDPWLMLCGFLLGMLVACATIANDLKMGAFQFYFARPIRPRDYVIGKLAGLFLLVGIPLFGGPVVLALVRLLMTDGITDLTNHLSVIPRAIALGAFGTAAFVLPSAGIGALMQSRVPAQAMYAIYFFLVGFVANLIGYGLKIKWIRLVSATQDVAVVGRALFGLDPDPRDPPAWAAAATVAGLCALGYFAIHWRVRNAETAGLGNG